MTKKILILNGRLQKLVQRSLTKDSHDNNLSFSNCLTIIFLQFVHQRRQLNKTQTLPFNGKTCE